MRAVVTGSAGFIGSNLVRTLLEQGMTVVGIDSLVPYYPRWIKERNLAPLLKRPEFTLVEEDLLTADLSAILVGADYCFHLAAQPGVRASWGPDFERYTQSNVLGTQRVLEAARQVGTLRKVVCASSSSVYGRATDLPIREDANLRPISPYGVSKLSTEHLCRAYSEQFSLRVTWLRYFSVYGPGQRPDMAFHRFIRAALAGEPIHIYGDGSQTRDFTYVTDAIAATVAAATGPAVGPYNVGGGSRVTLLEVLDGLEELTGRRIRRTYQPVQAGDVPDAWADLTRAHSDLGYQPSVDLRKGLSAEVNWVRELYQTAPTEGNLT